MTQTDSSRSAARFARGLALGLLALAAPLALAAQEAEGAKEPGMLDVNVGLTIWTIVVFLVLVAILGKLAWKPILDQAATRERKIQEALDEASRRQVEAAAMLEQHRAQLADARRQAQEIVNEGKAAGERLRKEIEEKARGEGQQLVERAKREIDREKDAALNEIRKESVDLALAAAGRLMQEKLDPQKDRQLVVGYLEQMAKQAAGSPRA
jgi:F-type H+-transporting ATPase subunit b